MDALRLRQRKERLNERRAQPAPTLILSDMHAVLHRVSIAWPGAAEGAEGGIAQYARSGIRPLRAASHGCSLCPLIGCGLRRGIGEPIERVRFFSHQHRKAAFLTRPEPGHALGQVNRRLGIDRRGRGNQIIEDGQNGRQIIRTRRADDE